MPRMVRRLRGSRREPTIALINVVFLMLIFFLVAGTIAPQLDPDLTLVSTEDLEGRAPPDTLVVHADAALSYRGAPVEDAAAFVAELPEEMRAAVRVVPDRDLAASDLVRIAGELRAAGAARVLVVTERALQ